MLAVEEDAYSVGGSSAADVSERDRDSPLADGLLGNASSSLSESDNAARRFPHEIDSPHLPGASTALGIPYIV